MKNAVVVNWKTSVIGLILAAVYAWQAAPQGMTPKAVLITIAIAVFGAACKDADGLHLGMIDNLVLGHIKTQVKTQLEEALKSTAVPKLLVIALLLVALPFAARAQTTATPPTTAPAAATANITNLYAGGLSYNVGGSPAIAGTGLYARLLSDGTGTYAFTVMDALPVSTTPFTVNTNVAVGIAQKIATIAGVPIFIPTSAGISFNGQNTGWAWSTGGMAPMKVKGNLIVAPMLRLVKSSVSNGAGYQPVIGVLFGWGQ